MLKIFAFLSILIQSGNFEMQPNFTIINGCNGCGIKTQLTNTALSFIDPSGVVKNQLNIKLPSKTFVEMDPVCLTRRNMAKNDIEGYDKIQFQSPKVLLGDKFDECFTKKLCETHSLAACNRVKRFEYTKVGKKICRKVCRQQKKHIHPMKMTKVNLTHSYCRKVSLNLLQATCICVFEISFKKTFNFLFFHFTPNCLGQLAMIYFEAGLMCRS